MRDFLLGFVAEVTGTLRHTSGAQCWYAWWGHSFQSPSSGGPERAQISGSHVQRVSDLVGFHNGSIMHIKYSLGNADPADLGTTS